MDNTVCCSNKLCGRIVRLAKAKKSNKFPGYHWCNACWPQLRSSMAKWICVAPGPHHQFKVSKFFYESQGRITPRKCPEHREKDETVSKTAVVGCKLWARLKIMIKKKSTSGKSRWGGRALIAEPLSMPTVHDASLATPPSRRTPFKNRPLWAIRKPADEIIAPSDRYEAPMRHARDTSNTAIVYSPLLEIADSIDGRAVDDVTDKRPRPWCSTSSPRMNGLVNNGQPPAKRPCRASFTSSSVRPEGLNRKEEILDSHD